MPRRADAQAAVYSSRSAGRAERQIDPVMTGERMVSIGERLDPVEGEPCRATPHDNITALQPHATWPIVTTRAAEEKDRRQPERDRDDRRAEVALVPVLVHREPSAGLVAVDQARIGLEAGESTRSGGARGDALKDGRQRRPGPSRHRVDRLVAIAGAIRHPAEATAIGR